MVTMPTYTIEVAWTEALTGVFRVGISEVGSTSDVLGSGFGSNVFDDVTSYTQAVQIVRGRTDDLGQMGQGLCTITLKDSTGRFNPENPNSDLAGYIVPLRPVRIKATYDGSTYGVYYGYTERVEHDPGARVTSISAVDFFEWLDRASQVFTSSTGLASVGAAIGSFLDALEFTDPALRDLDTGRSISTAAFAPVAETSYLSQIGTLLDYDRGQFFITKDGAAQFIAGSAYWSHGTPAAALDGSLASDMRVAVDKQRIVNRQQVTKTGSTAQTATDETSRRRYGYRDGDPLESAYLASETEALDLAKFIVAIRKDPAVPARAIEVKSASTSAIRNQLTLEIGDWVTFSEPRGGTDAEGVIEGVEHLITHAGKLHTTRYLVSKRTVNLFTVGASEVGGDDVLGW